MFTHRLLNGLKDEKRIKARRADVITEQVKKILQASDQKLILMVRS